MADPAHGAKRAVGSICALVTAILVAASALSLVRGTVSSISYERYADGSRDLDSEPGAWHDEPNLVGWVTVEGTPIDLPVVQTGTEDGNAHYLTHDLWDNPSPLGCPFLDDRAETGGRHLLIYGHRGILAEEGLTSIAYGFQPEAFRKLGNARWVTRERQVSFAPLMALHVDKRFQDIQRFSFPDAMDLREWLEDLADRADARVDGETFERRLEEAECALSLVTCTTPLPQTTERTIVIWVSRDAVESEGSDLEEGIFADE